MQIFMLNKKKKSSSVTWIPGAQNAFGFRPANALILAEGLLSIPISKIL